MSSRPSSLLMIMTFKIILTSAISEMIKPQCPSRCIKYVVTPKNIDLSSGTYSSEDLEIPLEELEEMEHGIRGQTNGMIADF